MNDETRSQIEPQANKPRATQVLVNDATMAPFRRTLPYLFLSCCACTRISSSTVPATITSNDQPPRPPLLLAGSAFNLNCRAGASAHDGEQQQHQDRQQHDPTPDDVINSLVRLLSRGVGDGEERDARIEKEEAQLWRKLGKLRLDAGEYAEAARIFRYGSQRCPSDDGLRHHCRVFNAFHGDCDDNESGDGTRSTDKTVAVPEPLRLPTEDGNSNIANDEIFLILDVPPDKVPTNIREFSGIQDASVSIDPGSPLTRLICASKTPILSKAACSFLIQSAQEAVKKRGGWTTDRHVHAPTCDIPAFDLSPSALQWIRRGMTDALLPLIASSFPSELGITAENLRIQDCFVVRYDGEEQGGMADEEAGGGGGPGFASLRPHEDESHISLTIALNDMGEYEGGGLFVASTGDLLNGDAGTVLCFAGGLVHGGYPVSRGTRWILTVFLYIDKNLSGKEPGYILKQIDNAIL